jgi:hypothetical protein
MFSFTTNAADTPIDKKKCGRWQLSVFLHGHFNVIHVAYSMRAVTTP